MYSEKHALPMVEMRIPLYLTAWRRAPNRSTQGLSPDYLLWPNQNKNRALLILFCRLWFCVSSPDRLHGDTETERELFYAA